MPCIFIKLTGDKTYLQKSVALARKYLQQRVYQQQTAFNDPMQRKSFLLANFYRPMDRIRELYELTKDTAFLNAAQSGARHYTHVYLDVACYTG